MSGFKIDVTRHLAEMERVLRASDNPGRREEIFALLRCWQHDHVLDEASRSRAQLLVRDFGARHMRAPWMLRARCDQPS